MLNHYKAPLQTSKQRVVALYVSIMYVYVPITNCAYVYVHVYVST